LGDRRAETGKRPIAARAAYLLKKRMGLILLIIIILLLIGAFPTGGYGFGYRSHGLLGTILIIILILWLLGRI
jgi:hypothetical protein